MSTSMVKIKSHTCQVGDPQMKIPVSQRFSHRSENSETHIRLTSLGIWHQEEEPSEHLALKVSGASSKNLHRTGGNKQHSWREHTRSHADQAPGVKAVTSQETGPDLSACPEWFLRELGMAVAHCQDKNTGGRSTGEYSLV